ncbi:MULTISPECIES: ribosomal protein L7/L12 [unclassified Rhodococcus (in: high G+C Gram-positive bacteria)]|uniref:ribosomal protein L7/L12 n=1 Tax=unclassified Rhodococcus (in: high G+C Gram-positive bacteria) TaxID=192944 RepID=UPI0016AB43A5|nr:MULTISPECIES: ribosomal protein L7/L12 [unclassified Rhodococcus (in: high G+C Gram-positive bacteria)]NIL76858.1 50S ribosomal protein L7/L12 [Rhodococcus sp. B10]
MPTWGWFIVALVLVDTAVLAAWLLARKAPGKNSATTTQMMLAGLDDHARNEIYRLVGEKKQINAVKLFRERTGAGLKEAKDIVDSVGRGEPLPTPGTYTHATGLDTGAWEDIIPKLRTLKSEGRTIAAIKLLRARTGLTLREAKEAVDRL